MRLTPYGPGPVKALEKFLEIAERDGYETTNVRPSAGRHYFGQGRKPDLARIVVPTSSG